MGCIGFGSSSKCDSPRYFYETVERVVEKKLPNPDPSNYSIIDSWTHKNYLLVKITYPDCKNYEGTKILLYHNVTLKKLKGQKLIDPHFSENTKYYSPIARFVPTKLGWLMGKELVFSLAKLEL